MRTKLSAALATLALAAAGFFATTATKEDRAMADDTATGGPMLAHMVYFSVHEPVDANRQKLVALCKKYLADHPGTVFFAVGTLADYDREVNDRDFDVALQLVFKDRAAHDAYQIAPKHQQFINEGKPLWKKVRVFDASVTN
jgi:quinol monooxygenase YgiN